MSDRQETFPVGDRPEVSVGLPSGRLTVENGPADAVIVEITGPNAHEFEVSQSGQQVSVRWNPSRRLLRSGHRVRLEVPESTRLVANLASSDLDAATLRELDVRIASGDVRVRRVSGDVSVKTASGDIEIEFVGGRLTAASASGDITVAEALSDCSCTTASGDVSIGTARGDVAARSASGDIDVDRFEGRSFRGKTVSGDTHIDIPRGRSVELDLNTMSGRCRLPEPGEAQGEGSDRPVVDVSFKSVSGDLEIGIAP
ncbi:MAG: DUF4097 domain-containing protein [Acidimicrobiia bacterium]|nr:DUF4097 domain-containing protein [Acidimicrobiia bacterium]